jgi:hypothetical protein
MADCSQLITSRKYSYIGKNELCAGRKKKFKSIQLFKKEGDKFSAKGNLTNHLGKSKIFNLEICKGGRLTS